jgi:hypothetical protein
MSDEKKIALFEVPRQPSSSSVFKPTEIKVSQLLNLDRSKMINKGGSKVAYKCSLKMDGQEEAVPVVYYCFLGSTSKEKEDELKAECKNEIEMLSKFQDHDCILKLIAVRRWFFSPLSVHLFISSFFCRLSQTNLVLWSKAATKATSPLPSRT